jgi:hypothetical protein
MALRIAGEVAGNAVRRLGHQFARGLDELDRATAGTLGEASETARAYVETAVRNEGETLRSILEIAGERARVEREIAASEKAVEETGRALLSLLEARMRERAAAWSVPSVRIQLSALEREAARIIPRPTARVRMNGYLGYQEFIDKIPDSERRKYPYDEVADVRELQLLINGKNSVLNSGGRWTPIPEKNEPSHVLNYLKCSNCLGLIEK